MLSSAVRILCITATAHSLSDGITIRNDASKGCVTFTYDTHHLLEVANCDGPQVSDVDRQFWSLQDGQLKNSDVDIQDGCAQVLGYSNGDMLSLRDCHSGDDQQWVYDPDLRTIHLAGSATANATKCLQIGDLTCLSCNYDKSCANWLEIWDCNGDERQLWQVEDHTQEGFVMPIQNNIVTLDNVPYHPGMCLGPSVGAYLRNGTSVGVHSCDYNSGGQHWTSRMLALHGDNDTIRFSGRPVNNYTVPDGTFCLDIQGELKAGARIVLWECSADRLEFQTWRWSSRRLSLAAHPSWCLEGGDIDGKLAFMAECSDWREAQMWSRPGSLDPLLV